MWNRAKNWMGLGKHSEYVKNYYGDANIRASVYMSVVVIILETWMILRTLIKYVILSDESRDFHWIITHFYSYCLLLAGGVVMLVFAVRYLKGKTENRLTGLVLIIILSAICLWFGMYISSVSYATGGQILTFLTMEIFVCTLLVWRPYISFLLLSGTFIAFYSMALKARGEFLEGDLINYFCYFIAALMVSFSFYHQRMKEATKAESLEAMNKHLEKIAVEDDITGIKNMNYFVEKTGELLKQEAERLSEKIFLYLDIENFKSYNDQYGFERGCDFLIQVAKKIDTVFSDSVVTRQSDDHFLVYTERAGARERIETIRNYVRNYQDEVNLGLKVGGYIPVSGEIDPRLAGDKARYACGLIKKMYDKDYKEYDEQVDEKFHKKQYIVNTIDKAVENGMRTLAEGVETEEQSEFLLSIGCERLQGYLYGKPMKIEELKEKIAAGEYHISDVVL